MKNVFLILLCITTFLESGLGELEEKSPLKPIINILSPDKTISITLYTNNQIQNYKRKATKTYIQIIKSSQSHWLSNIDDIFHIESIKFIDNKHVLIISSSEIITISTLLNTDTYKQKLLGNGHAKYISSGKDKGNFLLSASKGYFPNEDGAYWSKKIVDKDGDLIKFLSYPKNGSTCIQIKKLLYKDQKYPKLKQKLTNCIFVDM